MSTLYSKQEKIMFDAISAIDTIHAKTLIDTPRLALSYVNPNAGMNTAQMETDATANEIQLRLSTSGAIISHTKPRINPNAIANKNFTVLIFILLDFC